MFTFKNVSFITDNKGNKKSVLLQVDDFNKLQDEIDMVKKSPGEYGSVFYIMQKLQNADAQRAC